MDVYDALTSALREGAVAQTTFQVADNTAAADFATEIFRKDFLNIMVNIYTNVDTLHMLVTYQNRLTFQRQIYESLFGTSFPESLKDSQRAWLVYSLTESTTFSADLKKALKSGIGCILEPNVGRSSGHHTHIVQQLGPSLLHNCLNRKDFGMKKYNESVYTACFNDIEKSIIVCHLLGIYGILSEPSWHAVLLEVAKETITEHLQMFSQKNDPEMLKQPSLDPILSWLDGPLMNALCEVQSNQLPIHIIDNCRAVCKNHAYIVFFNIRCTELFEILVEFPESKPALDDIKKCIDVLGKNSVDVLLTTLQQILHDRLLHAGATTNDILMQYVVCVRALRAIDPDGVTAEKATRPLRKYVLKMREDAVRCIVAGFTDESSDLYADLQDDETDKLVEDQTMDDSTQARSLFDEQDDDFLSEWQPIPRGAPLSFFQLKQWRSRDTLRAFVQIFGSRDRFVSEYLLIFAGRVLSQLKYDSQKERQTIEWLKLRCGEHLPSIHQCEVMLKDITDSKRVDQLIHTQKKLLCVHPIILSRLFWPPHVLTDSMSKINLPDAMESQLQAYSEVFETMKPERKLEWHRFRGKLKLGIEVQGKEIEMVVTAIQAAVLLTLVERKDPMRLDDIAHCMNIEAYVVRKALSYWIHENILKETDTQCYAIVDKMDKRKRNAEMQYEETSDDIVEPSISSSYIAVPFSEQEATLYWTFIHSMLMNLGGLPIDRIHSMLAMFAQAPLVYDKTSEQLQALLKRMIQEDKLEFSAGLYKLKK